jgi:CBS domain containing-hemolysin-like protein
MLLASGVIGFLILLTALYVAAEFAAVGVRRSRLRRMAEDGHPLACRLLPTLEDPEELDRYIAVSQVGITLSSLVLGAYGQAVLAPRLEPLLLSFGLQPPRADSWAALFVLLSLTVAHMILGELVPKSLALQFPTQTALLTVLPMQWSQRMLKWSISALNGSGIVLLKLLRVPPTGHRHVHSPQEIELLIAESRDGGLLEPQEQVRLHRALRLGLRTARELMVPRARLAGIDEGAPFEAVLRVVIASPFSRLPVYRGSMDNIIGILHTKDVVTDFINERPRESLGALLKPIVRVRDTMPADKLLTFLREHRSHQALVVDAAGAVVGLITVEDVVAELLGGVSDEFKTTQMRALRMSDGRVRLPGAMRLEQAAQIVPDLPRWSGETVGGFIVAEAGRLPDIGERLTIYGLDVDVEAVENGVVLSAIVSPRAAPEGPR